MHLLILKWFYSVKRFKIMQSNVSFLSKLKPYKKNIIMKSMPSKFWVCSTYNRIYMLDINVHSDLCCTGMQPALLFWAEELNRSALTNRPWKSSGEVNSRKHICRRSNDNITHHTIMNELYKFDYQLYIYSSSSMKYKTLIYSNTGIFSKS